jgi:hypothetical protein
MSYTTRHGLGATGIAGAAGAILEDPCLSEVTSQILRLQAIEAARRPARTSGGKPSTAPTTKGIGLCNALPGIKLFVAYRQRPWTAAAIALGVIGGIFALGYAAGSD